jgi:hypothetical protein
MIVISLPKIPAERGINQYTANRAPLLPSPLVSLPVGAVRPLGWIKEQLGFMVKGLAGNLGNLSPFLGPDNGWLERNKSAWEEQPYFFRALYELAALTRDSRLEAEAAVWLERILDLTDEDGYWGPEILKAIPLANGIKAPDLWPQMLMLDALMSHYDRTADKRVLPLMLGFFRWCAGIKDESFIPQRQKVGNLEYYSHNLLYARWMLFIQRDRAGDMLPSLYWLYNHTGETFLLSLADRFLDRLRPAGDIWLDKHVVHFTQRFRYFGNHYLQTHDKAELEKTEYYYDSHMAEWGQMPGGVFAADERIREGKTDPRQGFETCGVVEFCKSFYILSEITGETKYADRSEDILFNTFPATHDPKLKSLHYLTACNQVMLDSGTIHDFSNNYRQLDYSSFSIYRCCQHNSGFGWPSFARRLWMAADGDGLAAWMYGASTVDAVVRGGVKVHIEELTDYPFKTDIHFNINPEQPVEFPLYLRVPSWAKGVHLRVNGKEYNNTGGPVICIEGEWEKKSYIDISFDAHIECHTWEKQHGAVSVHYGPLSYSLKIKEDWKTWSGTREWPEQIVSPASDWNYGIIPENIAVKERRPTASQPWIADNAPIELSAQGRKVPEWGIQDSMVNPLPVSPVTTKEPVEELTLIPMGCARLRISCFPVCKKQSEAEK